MKKLLFTLLIALPLLGSAQQWVIDFKDEFAHSNFSGSVINEYGDIIAVGDCGESIANTNPMMVRISNGEDYEVHVVANDSLFGFLNQGLNLCGIIQQNDNYFTTVNIPTPTSPAVKFGVIVFDSDFEIISSKLYDADPVAEDISATHLLIDDDGTVVLCGFYEYTKILENGWEKTVRRPFFYRFNEMGDSLSCRYVKPTTSSDPEYFIESFACDQIKKNPRSDGFIVFGNGVRGLNSVLFYDKDFNYINQFYPHYSSSVPMFHRMNSDTWLSEDRMLVYGHGLGADAMDLKLADISLDGTVNRLSDIYNIPDTCINVGGMRGMAMFNDTTVYGSYYKYRNFKKDFSTKIGVCLFTRDMEVLAIKTLPSKFNGCYPEAINSLPDGGCVLSCSRVNYSPYHHDAVIVKLSREDLNPIPCGVKEIPQERLQALAFPNPTNGELNIDISGIPENTENRVSITDMQGMVRMSRIIRGDGNLLTIDVSSLEAGAYVYSVFNNEKELLKGKFVKE